MALDLGSPCSCRRCHPNCPGECDDCLREAYEWQRYLNDEVDEVDDDV